MGRPESILLCDESYESRVEQTKQSMADEMLRKEEDMRREFVLRVRETEKVLKEREEAVCISRLLAFIDPSCALEEAQRPVIARSVSNFRTRLLS